MEFEFLDPLVDLGKRGFEEGVLAAEIVVDHPLVHLGEADDLVDRHRVEAVLGEEADRGLQNAAAGAVGIALNRRGRSHGIDMHRGRGKSA